MTEKKTSLRDLPKNLRKIVLVYAESDTKLSFKDACELADVPYEAARHMDQRYRAKGIDFRDLLDSESKKYLWENVPALDRKAVSEAISGSCAHYKEINKLLGRTTDTPLVQINNQSLTVIATPPASIPADLVDILPKEKGEMRLTSMKPNSSK